MAGELALLTVEAEVPEAMLSSTGDVAGGQSGVGSKVIQDIAFGIFDDDISQGHGALCIPETELQDVVITDGAGVPGGAEGGPIAVGGCGGGTGGAGSDLHIVVSGVLGDVAVDLVVTLDDDILVGAQSLGGLVHQDLAFDLGTTGGDAHGTLGSVRGFGADRKATGHCEHRDQQCEGGQDRDKALARKLFCHVSFSFTNLFIVLRSSA